MGVGLQLQLHLGRLHPGLPGDRPCASHGLAHVCGLEESLCRHSRSIPQSRKYIPSYAGLELTKIVIWTAPDEKVDDFYVFIDEVNEITDMYVPRFDGEDLADPDTINNLWQQGNK